MVTELLAALYRAHDQIIEYNDALIKAFGRVLDVSRGAEGAGDTCLPTAHGKVAFNDSLFYEQSFTIIKEFLHMLHTENAVGTTTLH